MHVHQYGVHADLSCQVDVCKPLRLNQLGKDGRKDGGTRGIIRWKEGKRDERRMCLPC